MFILRNLTDFRITERAGVDPRQTTNRHCRMRIQKVTVEFIWNVGQMSMEKRKICNNR